METFILTIGGIIVVLIVVAVIVGYWFVERPIKIYEDEKDND